MGHVNPNLLQEFLQIINAPLLTNGKNSEELTFTYDKDSEQMGLFIDGVIIQWVPHEIWAIFST